MRKIFLVVPVIALIGGSALAIFAGPASESGVVDGWVIGDPVSCTEIGASSQAQCQALIDRAAATMTTKAGTTILHESTHRPGARVVNGEQVLQAFSSSTVLGLVLVEFSDGRRHAAPFGCVGVPTPSATRDQLCPYGGTPFP